MIKYSIIFLVSALLVAVGGCDHSNANYCAGKLNDDCRSDGGTQVTGCVATPSKCTGMTSVCDTDKDVCVPCNEPNTQAASCPAAAPVCSSQTCGVCTADAQCDSGVCRADGTCSLENTVVYVSLQSIVTGCTSDLPCDLHTGLSKIEEQRNVLHLAPGTYAAPAGPAGISIVVPTVIVGRGATVSRGAAGPTIATSVDLTVEFLTVTGGLSATGTGIEVTAGTFAMTRSLVFGNKGGGVSISGGSFKITNSVIVENGDAGSPGSTFGGVRLTSTASDNVFEQNTVAFNHSQIGNPGLACTTLPVFRARRNIVTSNNMVMTLPVMQAVGCNDTESYLSAGTAANDLNFASLASPPNLHLTENSPATVRDIPELTTCQGVDIDGEARPKNGFCDLGADEF